MLLLFPIAVLCAALMGFAIQRGGTCLVAAVDQIVRERRPSRLVALLEASLLVAAGMVVAQIAGLLPMSPRAFAISGWTVVGGVTMGIGAYLAGACVFGAIARIGNGEFAFLLVPAGFLLGCLAALQLGMTRLPRAVAPTSPVLGHAYVFAVPLLALVALRLWKSVHAVRRGSVAAYVWSPHVATTVIGLTFVILLLVAGPWNYTDYLAEAARHMARNGKSRGGLLLALFGGAVLGGWTAGRIRPVRPSPRTLLRCLGGGILLGLGGSLVPGANDGLILLGLPLAYPHAWLAFVAMLIGISGALVAEQHVMMARSARLA